ncbi:hypothetical protein [Alienimonas californiensis]|uniref:Cephalosporin hydroxylase n=1 Tax=Alienimonas californiensis TaxID=2527989 RepID=A0A517P6D2_9PLAN|nr:hypothetical protein [Alienimonas californiensis]QDT14915.1 hypothetical protein CA12_09950 [Alienimonas californiensis]
MTDVTSIGRPPWSRAEMAAALPEFERLYAARPIRHNVGGMRFPHMFAAWFMARRLAPPLIVESGVYKGQGTWLLEQACPDAKIVALDPDLSQRIYRSEKAVYSERDFSEYDWSDEPTGSALAFFDDHQNAFSRLQLCKWFGFRDVIFEDNYPPSQGDCYSLKQAFAGAGFAPAGGRRPGAGLVRKALRSIERASGFTPQFVRSAIPPNVHDAAALRRNLEIYHEFPPVFQTDKTRWGDDWTEPNYLTPAPLLEPPAGVEHPVAWGEAASYTWICYARLAG